MAWSTRPTMAAGSPVLTEDLDAQNDRTELLSGLPVAHLRQTVAQTLTSGATTVITFTTEDIDTHNGHSTSVNTSRYTCQLAGIYELSGGVGWSSNSTGRRGTWWRKNGTDIDGSEHVTHSGVTGTISTAARTILVSLAVNDYVELTGTQESGGNLNTAVVATQQSTMSVRMVSPSS